MRVRFNEVIGFVILGVLLLAGVYVQVSDLYHELNKPVDFDAEGMFTGQVLMEGHVKEEQIGDSLRGIYVSRRDNEASTCKR